VADWGERSAEEREAARLERERRRAQRQGSSGPEDPRRSVEDPRRSIEDPPARSVDLTDDREEMIDEPFAADGHDHEVPLGTRRVSREQRHGGARRLPMRTAPRGGRQKHSLIGRIASLLALVLGAAVIWFLVELFQPFHGSGHGSVTVTIPAHSRSKQVGNLLERDGVISSAFFFELRATLAGERGDLLPGTYHLKLDMSYGDVLKILTTPPPAARTTNVTLIEGLSRRQIDGLLRSQGIRGSYVVDTRHSRLLDPRRYGAPASTPSLEGFLFPSTFQLREPISTSALVADQLTTFKREFATVNLSFARSRGLTPYDVLIIASMVQGEAQTRRDLPLVASVIYNRLRLGMPLQLDDTTRFAVDNYTSPLTVSQLNSPSPYNTRIHKGLPPTPINNPGLAAIQAAAHPANTNYLYFVVKPCGNGEEAFASTWTQAQVEIARYQAARSKRGGKSPARC
jgi:UPF0755 protein